MILRLSEARGDDPGESAYSSFLSLKAKGKLRASRVDARHRQSPGVKT